MLISYLHLDLENLRENASDKKPQYEFKISRNINLNFNCDVKALRYRRFYALRSKRRSAGKK